MFKQGCAIWGQGESDGLMFVQHSGLDKLDTGPIVLNIKGALFDTGDQTIVKQNVKWRSWGRGGKRPHRYRSDIQIPLYLKWSTLSKPWTAAFHPMEISSNSAFWTRRLQLQLLVLLKISHIFEVMLKSQNSPHREDILRNKARMSNE